MTTTPIPKSSLKDIEKIQRGFIWGDSEAGRRLHLVNWDTLLLPKHQGGLGLRSLDDMNKACLMKLAWNLKPEENKLWSQVLVGKYGRENWGRGELQCKISDSYIWKALKDCWDEIRAEEAWVIGDGTTVNFWSDKWLDKSSPLNAIVTNIPTDMLNWKVADYVDENKKWKMEILRDLLPDRFINRLVSCPVPDSCMGFDIKYWPGERSGKFSVASAYHYLRSDLEVDEAKEWRSVWRLAVPERVRTFAWQILHGKLATKLYCGKWSGSSVDCFHCAGVPESIQHVLRDCPRAASVWKQIVPFAMRANFFGYPFEDWVVYNILFDAGSGWSDLWATTCFFLWGWRNKEEHDDNFSRPHDPVTVIKRYVQQYATSKESFNPISNGSKTLVNICWKPASAGWVTLNTDGASKDGGTRSGCGGVLRDDHGRWLGGFSRYLGEANSYVAELWAVWEGLKMARSLGFPKIELQVDSKAVMASISNHMAGTFDDRGLFRRVKQLLELEWQVKVSHVYREANSVADCLASMGCEPSDELCIYHHPPDFILQFVHADCNGVSTPRLITV